MSVVTINCLFCNSNHTAFEVLSLIPNSRANQNRWITEGKDQFCERYEALRCLPFRPVPLRPSPVDTAAALNVFMLLLTARSSEVEAAAASQAELLKRLKTQLIAERAMAMADMAEQAEKAKRQAEVLVRVV